VQEAMDRSSEFYFDSINSNQPFMIVDSIGFSRGGPTASDFVNFIANKDIVSNNGNIPPELIILRSEKFWGQYT
jgi:hypothetical protein